MKINNISKLIFSIFLFMILLFAFYFMAVQPYGATERQAFIIAQKQGKLSSYREFYWYTGPVEYYTLLGDTADNQEIYLFINANTEETQQIESRYIISQEEAEAITLYDVKPAKILRVNLGLFRDMPAWEISYKDPNGDIGYYYISAVNGKMIEKITNI